jgi:hypothetical protein
VSQSSLHRVDDVIKSKLPHAKKGRSRGTPGGQDGKDEQHNNPIKARGSAAFELTEGGMRVSGHMSMEDFCKGNVLALAPWASVLAWVKKLVVNVVVHGMSAKEDPYRQVKIGFKKMQDP